MGSVDRARRAVALNGDAASQGAIQYLDVIPHHTAADVPAGDLDRVLTQSKDAATKRRIVQLDLGGVEGLNIRRTDSDGIQFERALVADIEQSDDQVPVDYLPDRDAADLCDA